MRRQGNCARRNRSSIDLAAWPFAGPPRCRPAYNFITDLNAANDKLADLVETAFGEGPALSIECLRDRWTSPFDGHLVCDVQVTSRCGTGFWISTILLPKIGGRGE